MSGLIPEGIQGLVLDMDGVLWRGETPIGDLPAIFERIRQRGLRVAFATNNGTRTPGQYVERLAGFGVQAAEEQVITSSLGLAELLGQRYPAGTSLFAVGEIGLTTALRQKGFALLSLDEAEKAQALVMGIDREINFRKMVEATLLVRRGAPFYATNPDMTFPTPRGEIPGAGAWLSVVITATGVQPIVAGKPGPYMIDLARQRLGLEKEETLVVGDRLETDIAGGQAAGCRVALVLSGVASREEGEIWKPRIDVLAENLGRLVE